MTTPANSGPHGGANQPEDEDPFGYLYADGQAAGATPPGSGGGYGYPGPAAGGQAGAQPGVPRTSYNQVRTVGDRRGQRGAVPYQPGPAQQGQPQGQQGYQAQYQAPEALQAGGYGVPQQQAHTQALPGNGGHGGGGSSRRGLLIAAVAVVVAVAIGIGAALAFGDKGKDKDKNQANGQGQQSGAPQNNSPSPQPSGSPEPSEGPLPKADASGAGMTLTGGAALTSTVPGAKSAGGQYVGNFNQPGAALTWSLDVAKAGQYAVYISYNVPGKDANTTLTVNGDKQERPINMKNFAKAKPGEWDKWTYTYSLVDLKKGPNTVKMSCETGNQCEIIIDQLWLQKP
ncbi:CBM35 domain-containing protein [Streptomyces sp. NBC_00539]|uniref:CBM35 domain-containing protein n=1 Tax=Streptomyces sp. NBC_00539 TaxID=2975770 RepID=UPI002E812CFC|nr:CBM35 domain-containing protein [Streptomyces sp. NBC_00539]WUC65338.1 carbohydrate-binding protein [Streptomyces sp. NBC_00539]